MADACTPTATATQFATITTSSTSTSFSASPTTLPDSVTTITTSSCSSAAAAAASGSAGAAAPVCETVTLTSTIPGGATTVQVPIVVTVPVTATEATATLFNTCPSGNGSAPAPPPPPSSQPSSAPQSSSASTTTYVTSVLSTSTPPDSTFTSSSQTTLADGSVVFTLVTVTSTGVPTQVYVPETIASTQTAGVGGGGGGGGHSSSHTGVIVGAVVGGVGGLILLVGLIWWLRKRFRGNPWADVFDEHERYADAFDPDVTGRRGSGAAAIAVKRVKDPRRDLVDLADTEPKPYHYGLVGQPGSSPPGEEADTSAHSHGPSQTLSQGQGPSPPGSHAHSPGNSLSAGTAAAVGGAVATGPATDYLNVRRRSNASLAASNTGSNGSPSSGGQAQRRPASLTLANWNPDVDGPLSGPPSELGTSSSGMGPGQGSSAPLALRTPPAGHVQSQPPPGMSEKARLRWQIQQQQQQHYQEVIVHQDAGRVATSPSPVHSPAHSPGPSAGPAAEAARPTSVGVGDLPPPPAYMD